MATALKTDPASILRAIGLLRSHMAGDDTHINAVMEAIMLDQLEHPDERSLMHTFSAMFAIAVTATASLALANVYGDDEDQVLDALQRQLIIGDVTPPEAIS